eukprot:TRINITY_DN3917_c0_g1_i1.p1 TRINITY_DN3917_c0_g1~~TRINITY_DN3917_c0_g1_i1.p1  ORF type:complete len:514 (-),score=138.32 TRINITY_DN3917_c0_g1_i1:40-1581(-)
MAQSFPDDDVKDLLPPNWDSPFMKSVVVNQVPPAAPLHGRKTKIVCTVGPVTQSVEKLSELMHAGMNIARMNFSHGDHDYHRITVNNVREAAARTGLPIAIMLDTKGPEIRTTKLKGHKPITLDVGHTLTVLATADKSFEGDEKCIGIDYVNLPKVVEVGTLIKISDGLISLRVESIGEDSVQATVLNSAPLGETKNVNLAGVAVDLPFLSKRDREDLDFGVSVNVDMVAASFTRSAQDVLDMRNHLGEKGKHIKIICKIENVQGLDNFDEILRVCDGVMVARGDLGVDIPIQKVCMAQKMMIRKCNIAGKPVITATQMLESMIKNARPTRAEATDVANAVFDGTDCVMLSGETANGAYPIQAVQTMANICRTTELSIDYTSVYLTIFSLTPRPLTRPESISSAACKAVNDLEASLILILTESGSSARYVAKYKPSVPVLTLTHNEVTFRQCMLSRALWPVLTEKKADGDLVTFGVGYAKDKGWVETDNWVVVVSGTDGIQGSAHTLKVIKVL